MIRNVLFSLFIGCLLVSCSSYTDAIKADSNIRKIQLGMSKRNVISVMGKSYRSVGAIQTPDGNVEILGYTNAEDGMYKLHILNDKLIQWEYDKGRPPRREHHHNP
ncbi:hypothetical protein M2459_002432 [Parabacteroides sp. PF5-5]|uniref:hypothetical protein n=1 Tax=unclassified Parabacteroides TaxID=2649774 RepID=UPI00247368D4|nr:MULTISPECIES: hypothetical protein [unclassified Parabacteroides]MDH6316685.1 hypothetical protein [Parabacteroides sp. PF5-13]MDH6327812.1 hypothetical protein [Parabacteroides sp. PH5-41]MDH6335672.1 hypothetical protein [Parabacteroides sp. PF5-5]MDH6346676.1 hypothetical protein [Parabacteroides sp. PH5-46]MDH6361698.1 hypothetical protein [Parabacteroides sp. PH5-16]